MSASAQAILYDLAKRGLIKGATVINNFNVANALVELGVPTVVHRADVSAGGGGPAISGTDSDRTIGAAWWRHPSNQNAHNSLDNRVYIQAFNLNEQNAGNDGWFYLGLMQEADKQGRRLAIFADSVGNPNVILNADGSVNSPVWENRVASGCMTYGKAHGHIACVHKYGKLIAMKGTSDPGCEIFPDGRKDDAAWFWFGDGSRRAVYRDLVPADARMPVHIGECGCSNINLHGQAFVQDFMGYQTRLGDDPDVLSFAYWQLGGRGDIQWGQSCLDDDMPLLAQALS